MARSVFFWPLQAGMRRRTWPEDLEAEAGIKGVRGGWAGLVLGGSGVILAACDYINLRYQPQHF